MLTPWLLRYNISELSGEVKSTHLTFLAIALLLITHTKVQPIVTLFQPPTAEGMCAVALQTLSYATAAPGPGARTCHLPPRCCQGRGGSALLLRTTDTAAPQKLFNGFPDNSSFTPSTGPMELMNKIITFWQKLKRFSFHNANLDEITQFCKLF